MGFLVGLFGAGAVLSAFFVRRLRLRSREGEVGLRSLMALGVMMAVYALSPAPEFAGVALFLGGAAFLLGVSDFTAAMHAQLDDDVRGRVMALWGMAFLGVRPIAALIHGAIGDLAGPRAGIGFAVIVAGGAAIIVRRTALRGVERGAGLDRR